uniref:Dehydrogenase/reductase 13 n=1 Tax=Nothoprocta perdicaria TaxID=30464 RepID=A0A8C7EEV3_NOTPE
MKRAYLPKTAAQILAYVVPKLIPPPCRMISLPSGSSGIGLATALELARRGARVIVATHSAPRGEAAAWRIRTETGNPEVLFMHLDLASLRSVRAFASAVLRQEPRLHLLINNAGVSAGGRTEDGYGLTFQVNHLGHFLLTQLLLGRLRKLANVLHARELAARLRGTAVTCYAAHPGFVNTGLFRHAPLWLKPLLLPLTWLLCSDAAAGAATPLFCATAEGIERHSGRYFSDCRPREPWGRGGDDGLARALWDASERLVGLAPPSPPGVRPGPPLAPPHPSLRPRSELASSEAPRLDQGAAAPMLCQGGSKRSFREAQAGHGFILVPST